MAVFATARKLALGHVHRLVNTGHREVVDGDLSITSEKSHFPT